MEKILSAVSPADLGYGIALLFFLLRGLFRGFSKEVAGLIVMIAVAAGGWTLYRPFAAWLMENTRIKEVHSSELVALILSVVGLYIVLRFIGWVLSKIIDFAFTDKIERPGGMVAGVVQGIAWISLLVLAVAVSGHAYLQEELIEKSRIGSVLAKHVPAWWEKIDGALEIKPAETGTPEKDPVESPDAADDL